MSVGSRLREERQRLGLSQERFARVASVAKNTAINWEKDKSSPTAEALIAFAEAGADAVYILTGKHTLGRPDAYEENVRDRLLEIRRDLLDPSRCAKPGEAPPQTEDRVLKGVAMELKTIVKVDGPAGLPAELVDEAVGYLKAATDPSSLSLLRSVDFKQNNERREEEMELIQIWLQGSKYTPDFTVLRLMATISLEYGVSHRMLVELANAIHRDIEEQRWAGDVIQHHDRDGKPATGGD